MTTTSKRFGMILLGAILASLTSASAHVVRGLVAPQLTSAFVSSPSTGTDLPVRLVWGAVDTGSRVVCFSVANTSPPRSDRSAWPRVIGAGLELPGSLSGFALVAPIDDDWELVEGVGVPLPGRGHVVLDFAVVTRANPTGRMPGRPREPAGIPPGQTAVRGSGTRFCVSGPFPDRLTATQDTTIEQLLNGVVVGFAGVEGNGASMDLGIWTDPQRVVPLYPQ
jgi:hypothetical protein